MRLLVSAIALLLTLSIVSKNASALIYADSVYSPRYYTDTGELIPFTTPETPDTNYWLRGVGYLASAEDSDWPYCTVQAIRNNVLITAAHCVDAGKPVDKVFAKFDIDNDGSPDVVRKASLLVTHPSWEGSKYPNDIALIFLKKALPDSVPVYRIETAHRSVPYGLPIIIGGYGTQGRFPFGVANNQDIPNAIVDGMVVDLFDRRVDKRFGVGRISAYDRSKDPSRLFYSFAGTYEEMQSRGLNVSSYPGGIAPGDSGGGVYVSPVFQRGYQPPVIYVDGVAITEKILSSVPTLLGINSHTLDKKKTDLSELCPTGIFDELFEFFSTSSWEAAETCKPDHNGFVFLKPHTSWITSTINSHAVTGFSIPEAPASSYVPTRGVSFSSLVVDDSLPEAPQEYTGEALIDAFPEHNVASLDSDADGYPDRWTIGSSYHEIASSGLTLDKFPYRASYAVDDDGDNIADEWELWFFGSILQSDEVSDFDGDGVSDLNEFVNETDPTVSDYEGTEDNNTEDNNTEDNNTEDNNTEDNSTEDNSTEDNSTEDNSTEEFPVVDTTSNDTTITESGGGGSTSILALFALLSFSIFRRLSSR